jgi:predicted phage-related endonuclease
LKRNVLPCTVEVYPDRGKWLEARGRGIGSSDAPTILGYGYESSLELWGRLTGKLQPKPSNDNLRMRFGKAAESFIHGETEQALRTTLVHPGDFTVWRSTARPWQSATIDRLVTKPDADLRQALARMKKRTQAAALERLVRRGVIAGPGEFKTVSGFAVNGGTRDELSGWGEEPPAYVLIQVQHQLAVTGLSEAWVSALVGSGDELLTYHLAAHPGLQERLLEAEEAFWRLVQEDRPPAVDGSDKTRQALSDLFPADDGGEIVLGPEFVAVHQRLELAKGREAESKKARTEAENEIKLAMGTSTRAVVVAPEPGIGAVAAYQWKVEPRSAYSVAASKPRVLRSVKP